MVSVDFNQLTNHIAISRVPTKIIKTSRLLLSQERRDNGTIKKDFIRRQEKGRRTKKIRQME